MTAPWLGNPPSGWREVALRYLARVETGSRDTVDAVPGGDYPFIIRSKTPLQINSYSYDTEAVLTAGDGAIGEIFHHLIGKFEVHQRVYVIHDFRGLLGRFFFYYFSSEFSQTVAYGGAQSTVASLRRPMLTGFPVAVPPMKVQRAIVDYLDRETAQIDAFIANNEELITLLTERRAAVVAQYVSRGLRHGVALKASGTEWATDVPSHWRVGNIRRFASMRTGHTPSRQHPEYWVDCDIPWFTLADVWQLRQGLRDMGKTSEKISSLGLAKSAAELLPAGTVALSRTASVGFAGVMPVEMATSQDFWNWIPRGELISEYLWYQFQAMKPEFERLMTGSTHRTIYQADAASITILVPPVSEQHEIVARLDTVTKRVDDAIASAHSGVALARERRAALISAAVTGKIDVGVAA